MTNPSADPLVGRTVAHYEIVARLGGGGMGVVYRAIDHKLDRPVAVKFLPPQWSHDDTAKQRFIREAQAASATLHPNICTIHDIETADDGQLFIVMAYYEGPTLKQRLEDGPLPVEEALDIATQVADGLAKAHAQGVVHRDIKPGNLILTEDGVRIVDFGLATFADALQLTTSGSTPGTAAYMSPEQSRGLGADARSDVWALGVVLYEMLAGYPPFRGAYAEAIAYAIRNDAPPLLRSARPEITEDVEQLVFRALHKEAAVRFQGGREFARALRLVRGFTVPQDLRTQVVVPPATVGAARRAPRRGRVAAAVVVAAVLTGLPAWVFMPIDPVTVAVMPVVNRTGLTQLDGFEFALQEEFAATLHTSPGVRRADAVWIREIIRPFRDKDSAIGVEALEAVRRQSGGGFVLLSAISSSDDGWTGRIDVQDSRGATLHTLSAGKVAPDLLPHDAAHQLTRALAAAAEAQFARQGPLRGRVRTALRHWLSGDGSGRFGSLAAAASFERGLDAYERLELATAAAAFTEAAKHDPRSPLIEAWRSRTALLMRREADAVDAAGRIALLPDGSLSGAERLFVEAVAAEAAKDFATAGARYDELVALEEREWIAERAAYLDRRTDDDAAILAWQRAIELGARSGRPDLELCRLNGPTRKDNAALALTHAAEASRKYAVVGSAIGEAQVAMCRADVLRLNGKLEEARQSADQARAILQEPNAPYQLPRALYYVGLTANAQQRYAEALEVLTAAQRAAASAGNGALEPFLLQALGETHLRLGDRRQLIEVNRTAADLFAAQGQVERAAGAQANAGSALIQFGDDPVEGFRLLENALGIFRKSGSPNNELSLLQMMAAYHRDGGRYTAADRLLAEALMLSKQSGRPDMTTSLQIDQARVRFDLGDYERARALVVGALEGAQQRFRTQTEFLLAQIEIRLGEFDAARRRLAAVSPAIGSNDTQTRMLHDAALGELEYESGRPDAARRAFRAAANTWGRDLPHVRAVEASAYAGLLDRRAEDVQRALDRARQTGRLPVEARARIFLARLALEDRRFDDALRIIEGVPADDGDRTLGPELRGQVQYWSAVGLRGRGDVARADAALADARQRLDSIRMRLPEAQRAPFAARADIRRVFE